MTNPFTVLDDYGLLELWRTKLHVSSHDLIAIALNKGADSVCEDTIPGQPTHRRLQVLMDDLRYFEDFPIYTEIRRPKMTDIERLAYMANDLRKALLDLQLSVPDKKATATLGWIRNSVTEIIAALDKLKSEAP